jgi:hypothetical protein
LDGLDLTLVSGYIDATKAELYWIQTRVICVLYDAVVFISGVQAGVCSIRCFFLESGKLV